MQSRALSILAVTGLLCMAGAAPAEAQRRQGGQEPQLPAGAGQQLVQNLCAQCHGLNRIVSSSGYDRGAWRALIDTMMALPDAQAIADAGVAGCVQKPSDPLQIAATIAGLLGWEL